MYLNRVVLIFILLFIIIGFRIVLCVFLIIIIGLLSYNRFLNDSDFEIGLFIVGIWVNIFYGYFQLSSGVKKSWDFDNLFSLPYWDFAFQVENESCSLDVIFFLVSEGDFAVLFLTNSRSEFDFDFLSLFGVDFNKLVFNGEIRISV